MSLFYLFMFLSYSVLEKYSESLCSYSEVALWSMWEFCSCLVVDSSESTCSSSCCTFWESFSYLSSMRSYACRLELSTLLSQPIRMSKFLCATSASILC